MPKILYAIRSDEFTKIGVTNDINQRIFTMQAGNPKPLTLITSFVFENAMDAERILHRKFKEKNHIREWFRLTDADIFELESMCELMGGVRSDGVGSSSRMPSRSVGLIRTMEIREISKDDLKMLISDVVLDSKWRIERTYKRGGGTYWVFRTGSGKNRKAVYGGTFERRIHSDKLVAVQGMDLPEVSV